MSVTSLVCSKVTEELLVLNRYLKCLSVTNRFVPMSSWMLGYPNFSSLENCLSVCQDVQKHLDIQTSRTHRQTKTFTEPSRIRVFWILRSSRCPHVYPGCPDVFLEVLRIYACRCVWEVQMSVPNGFLKILFLSVCRMVCQDVQKTKKPNIQSKRKNLKPYRLP